MHLAVTTERRPAERTATLQLVFWVTAVFAVTTNTVEAFVDPSGDWWDGLRLSLSILCSLSLIVLLLSIVIDRRRR